MSKTKLSCFETGRANIAYVLKRFGSCGLEDQVLLLKHYNMVKLKESTLRKAMQQIGARGGKSRSEAKLAGAAVARAARARKLAARREAEALQSGIERASRQV